MTASTPIARIAAFTKVAQIRGVDLGDIIDTVPNATRDGRHELRVSDLAVLLQIHAQHCPDVEHCETCHTPMCATHGLGERADCVADRVHCTSAWCFDQACLDAHAIDQAVDADRDEAVGCP